MFSLSLSNSSFPSSPPSRCQSRDIFQTVPTDDMVNHVNVNGALALLANFFC